jgi:hypothetical protein
LFDDFTEVFFSTQQNNVPRALRSRAARKAAHHARPDAPRGRPTS